MQCYIKEAINQEIDPYLVRMLAVAEKIWKNYNSGQGGMNGNNPTVLSLAFSSKITIANRGSAN